MDELDIQESQRDAYWRIGVPRTSTECWTAAFDLTIFDLSQTGSGIGTVTDVMYTCILSASDKG